MLCAQVPIVCRLDEEEGKIGTKGRMQSWMRRAAWCGVKVYGESRRRSSDLGVSSLYIHPIPFDKLSGCAPFSAHAPLKNVG